MSQVPTDPSVIALFSEFNKGYEKATADTGQGFLGEWPPRGQHLCTVTGITAEKAKRTIKGFEVVGVEVQFLYTCNDVIPGKDAAAQVGGFEWKGAPMLIPAAGFQSLPQNIQWMAREGDRLKGHLTAICGPNFTNNIMADLPTAMNLVATSKKVVNVDCQYQEAKPKPDPTTGALPPAGTAPTIYRKEFILGAVTG